MEYESGKKFLTTQPQSVECPYCGEIESRIIYYQPIKSPFDKDLAFGMAAIRECDSCRREWLIHILSGYAFAVVHLSKEEVE